MYNQSVTEPPFPIIKTKLFIPQVRHERVSRPRIIDILNQAVLYPLTLVSALPGSGKTTALAEWARQVVIPAAWYAIDEGDNDHNRFWFYFISALQTAAPGTGRAMLDVIHSPEPLSVENQLAYLVNDLAETGSDIVLILDDYHLVKAREIHRAIAFFLEHSPPQMHLVISTRADPNLPLSRLRARNSVLELRTGQLRFTLSEASTYLNQEMRLDLSANNLEILLERTEGWIAGLQMAALSLKGQTNDTAFLQAFSGSNRYILDYLVEEVLDQQPENIQAFLLKTCILDRMCAELCGELAVDSFQFTAGGEFPQDRAECQRLLDYLERGNLFLVPLDDERRWYRYHHIFAELLRARLAHSPYGPAKKHLHGRAASWYENKGLFEEAIHHRLAARDYSEAASLVELVAESAWLNGQYTSVLAWIKALPEELVHNRPWLCIWNAWALTQMGMVQAISQWIEAAEQCAGKINASADAAASVDAMALVNEIAALKAFAVSFSQDYDRAIRLAEAVLKDPPLKHKKAAQFFRCNILHVLSSMYYATGRLPEAEETCQATIDLAREIGFPIRYFHAANKLFLIYMIMGRLSRSGRLIEESLSILQEQGFRNYFAAIQLQFRKIELFYEWNRLEEMQQMVELIQKQEMPVEVPYLYADFYNIQALDLMTKQDNLGAQAALDKARDLAQKTYIWEGLTWRTETLQVRLWLKRSDIRQAAAWAAEQTLDLSVIIPFPSESRAIARARILLAQDACQEAISILNRLSGQAEASGLSGSLIGIRTLKAIALLKTDELEQAAAELEGALVLAEPEGYIRAFLDEGQPVHTLLAHIASQAHSPHKKYAAYLLAEFQKEEKIPGSKTPDNRSHMKNAPSLPSVSSAPLIEPLSRRELEVLHCMAEGLSNKETARRLVIETSTVKRHINTIFAKLGVSNRVQAINKAKEYGVL